MTPRRAGGAIFGRHRRRRLRRAVSSALLLLRSVIDAHPRGWPTGRARSGATTCATTMSMLMALLREPNHTVFQKTLAVSDYYFGRRRLGLSAGADPDVRHIARRADPGRGAALLAVLAAGDAVRRPWPSTRSISGCQSEDLPRPENRIYYDGDKVVLDIHENNKEAHASPEAEAARICSSRSARIRICSSGDCISARTSRSAAPRTRPAPAASARTLRASVLEPGLHAPTRWTISTSPTRASFRRSAR